MPEREDLSATHWFTSRLVVFLLVLAGAFFILRPDWLGYGRLKTLMGDEADLQGVGIGIAFVLLAAQSWERSQMRIQAAEMMEALHQLLYGKDYRRDREAIEILLTAMETQDGENARTAYGHLCRLTGQSFAQDPKVWRSWWEANRKRFERTRSGGDSAPRE
jgi:hypothetical protein